MEKSRGGDYMSKKFVDLHKEFNYKGEWQGTYIKIDISLIMKGVLQSLTATQLKVLLVIAAHMNEEGKCFPSIDRIMDLTNCARQTVVDAIKALINVEVDGVPLMSKRTEGKGIRKKNVYNFDIEGIETLAASEETIDTLSDKLNARDVLLMFMDEYKEEFDLEYKPMWARDQAMIKTQLLENFSDDEIRKIVKITVTEYKNRWYSPKFPAPTVGAMCKWICNEAIKIHKDREQRKAVSEPIISNTQEIDNSRNLW